MDVSHGRSARMSFDTAREMAKTLTPAQEIAHIENELRALGYTKTHEARQTKVTMKNPQYNPSTKTLEELRLQRRTATGVLPKSMEEHNIEKEVQEDGKVYRNARACTGGDMKMRYPGPHERPKKDDIIPHYETPTKTKHVKGSGRRSASNNDDAEYWSDDGGSWQRSNKDSLGRGASENPKEAPSPSRNRPSKSSSGAGNVESGPRSAATSGATTGRAARCAATTPISVAGSTGGAASTRRRVLGFWGSVVRCARWRVGASSVIVCVCGANAASSSRCAAGPSRCFQAQASFVAASAARRGLCHALAVASLQPAPRRSRCQLLDAMAAPETMRTQHLGSLA